MTRRLSLALVRLAAILAPARTRARWREEWLAEIDAAAREGRGGVFRLALGAPLDALSSRWTTREVRRGSRWHGPWRSDLKQTLRAIWRSPGHVLTVSLCLGAGIAVCTTTFSILNAIISGGLPGIEQRERLTRLSITTEEHEGQAFHANASIADYRILSEGSPSFETIAGEGRAEFAVRVPGYPAMNVDGAFVSGTYFGALGTRPSQGRLLTPADDAASAPIAVVLSHAFWKGRLGSPAGIIGRSIIIGGREAVVAGVTPERFSGLDIGAMGEPPGLRNKIYIPLAHAAGWPGAPQPAERWVTVIGRLKQVTSLDAIAAEMRPLAARIEDQNPAARKNAAIIASPLGLAPGATTAELAFIVMLMMAAPLTVLAIGCANVANLQLVRASLRTRELAVRVSLGASRGQVVRLLTLEAALLAATACGAGAFATSLLLRVAALVIPVEVTLDRTVLLFALSIAAVVIAATGLLPALMATRGQAAAGLRAGGRSMSTGNSKVRRGLVMAQVALCFLLLLAAAVFTRGLLVLTGEVPPDSRNILVAELRFDVQGYTPAERRVVLERFAARLRADSRVRAVGFGDQVPLNHGELRFWFPGDAPDVQRVAWATSVSEDFFNASTVHVLRGRTFTSADQRTRASIIVDEAFIARFQLREPVIGQSLRVELEDAGDVLDVTIAGVASPGIQQPLIRTTTPTVYLPFDTAPDYVAAWIRADDAARLAEPVKAALAEIDPELPPLAVTTLEEHFIRDTDGLRLIARAAGGLGTVSLVLAVSGLYSVIAFFVALRRGEFGIRMAIGARPQDIVQMVVGQALRLVLTGLAAGAVLGAPILLGLHAAFPFTQPFDPAVIVPTALALGLTALAASWLPARKAASIDPSIALRAE